MRVICVGEAHNVTTCKTKRNETPNQNKSKNKSTRLTIGLEKPTLPTWLACVKKTDISQKRQYHKDVRFSLYTGKKSMGMTTIRRQ